MRRKPRMTQAEKSESTRRLLFDAATRVVGRDGYAGASIAKITRLAGVAQGTFYYYFRSRQDLFDRLLPSLGERLLEKLRETVAGCQDTLKREELGFRAFFEFLAENPEFYRVLHEAAIFAPRAYRAHTDNISGRYLKALKQNWHKGDLPGYQPRELEALVYILSGAMLYLSVRYAYMEGRVKRIPKWVVQAYMKFIRGGFAYDPGAAPPVSLAAAKGDPGAAGGTLPQDGYGEPAEFPSSPAPAAAAGAAGRRRGSASSGARAGAARAAGRPRRDRVPVRP